MYACERTQRTHPRNRARDAPTRGAGSEKGLCFRSFHGECLGYKADPQEDPWHCHVCTGLIKLEDLGLKDLGLRHGGTGRGGRRDDGRGSERGKRHGRAAGASEAKEVQVSKVGGVGGGSSSGGGGTKRRHPMFDGFGAGNGKSDGDDSDGDSDCGAGMQVKAFGGRREGFKTRAIRRRLQRQQAGAQLLGGGAASGGGGGGVGPGDAAPGSQMRPDSRLDERGTDGWFPRQLALERSQLARLLAQMKTLVDGRQKVRRPPLATPSLTQTQTTRTAPCKHRLSMSPPHCDTPAPAAAPALSLPPPARVAMPWHHRPLWLALAGSGWLWLALAGLPRTAL